jgi:hypothetical protein
VEWVTDTCDHTGRSLRLIFRALFLRLLEEVIPRATAVGEYIDTAGVAHSFLLSNGVFTSFDPPGTGPNGSDATGINPGGVIVGLFVDASGAVHGFIRIP